MIVDRRTLLAIIACGQRRHCAPVAASGPQDNAAYFADLHEKAKKEGELTWYIAHWRVEIAERVAKRFTEVYPAIKCNVVRATGQVIYQRLTQDMKAKVANCDVFSSSDLGQYVSLKAAKQLMPFVPKNLADCSPLIAKFDPDGAYTITDGNTTVMCYNSDLVGAADAPRKWTDLIDPKWRNQVAVAHPGFSGAMGGWVLSMTNLYGWEFFEKLKANRPQIGRSLIDPPTMVASGERKVGIGSGVSVFGYSARGTSLKGVYPEDGTIIGFQSDRHPGDHRASERGKVVRGIPARQGGGGNHPERIRRAGAQRRHARAGDPSARNVEGHQQGPSRKCTKSCPN